jgi:integrase
MAKITKSAVDTAQASDKDGYLWDSQLKGFGLKITPAGRKVYLVQYRAGGRAGKTRRVTIGTHGSITADQARTEAQALLRQISRDEDPLAVSDKKKQEKTFGVLIDQFLCEHVDIKLKTRSIAEYRRLIEKLVPKPLKAKRISELVRPDISRLQQSLSSTPYQANRLLAVLRKFFNWCEKNGYRADHTNPALHVDKFAESRRNRFLSEVEIAHLGNVLASEDVSNRHSPFVIAAIRLLSLTGARLNEILSLKWEWVDFEAKCLRLPESKTGAKTVYLNPPALQVLADLPKLDGNPHVICGERPGAHLVNLQKPWSSIRKLAGLENVRIHDLRHTFASIAVANGMSLPMIGALLGHSQPQTTARYAHLSENPLQKAATIVGLKLTGVVVRKVIAV